MAVNPSVIADELKQGIIDLLTELGALPVSRMPRQITVTDDYDMTLPDRRVMMYSDTEKTITLLTPSSANWNERYPVGNCGTANMNIDCTFIGTGGVYTTGLVVLPGDTPEFLTVWIPDPEGDEAPPQAFIDLGLYEAEDIGVYIYQKT